MSFGKIFFYADVNAKEAVQMVSMKSPYTDKYKQGTKEFKKLVDKSCGCAAKMRLDDFKSPKGVYVEHGKVHECLYVTSTMLDSRLGMNVAKKDLEEMSAAPAAASASGGDA